MGTTTSELKELHDHFTIDAVYHNAHGRKCFVRFLQKEHNSQIANFLYHISNLEEKFGPGHKVTGYTPLDKGDEFLLQELAHIISEEIEKQQTNVDGFFFHDAYLPGHLAIIQAALKSTDIIKTYNDSISEWNLKQKDVRKDKESTKSYSFTEHDSALGKMFKILLSTFKHDSFERFRNTKEGAELAQELATSKKPDDSKDFEFDETLQQHLRDLRINIDACIKSIEADELYDVHAHELSSYAQLKNFKKLLNSSKERLTRDGFFTNIQALKDAIRSKEEAETFQKFSADVNDNIQGLILLIAKISLAAIKTMELEPRSSSAGRARPTYYSPSRKLSAARSLSPSKEHDTHSERTNDVPKASGFERLVEIISPSATNGHAHHLPPLPTAKKPSPPKTPSPPKA